jgi:hypothetical protein
MKLLSKLVKYSATAMIVLLTLVALTMTLSIVYAQDDGEIIEPFPFPTFPIPLPPEDEAIAYVTVLPGVGGTTDPTPGLYEYPTSDPSNPATYFGITAIPDTGYRFLYWVIRGTYLPGHNVPQVIVPIDPEGGFVPILPNARTINWDSLTTSQNPLNVICGYGYNYEYQPVFIPITPVVEPTVGTMVVLSAVGGSSNPQPGTYTYVSDDVVTLTATPATGYVFQHWVISGGPLPGHSDIENGVVTSNPLTTHSVAGEEYNYQPVFAPQGTTTTGGMPVEYLYAAIAILVIVAVIAIAAALMYRSRSKK